MVVAAFLSLFGVLCAQALLETARDTLFLTRIPVARLPWVNLALAVLTLLAGGASPALARWRDRWRRVRSSSSSSSLFLSLIIGAAITAALGTILADGHHAWVYVLFLWSGMFSALSATKIWMVLAETLDMSRAKQLYGRLAAGGGLGAVVGAALARVVGHWAPPHVLVWLAAAVVALTAVGPALVLARPENAEGAAGGEGGRAPSGIRELAHTVRHPYVGRLLLTTLLATAVATLLDFSFKEAVAARLPSERLPAFLASFHLTTSVLSLLAQLFGLAFVVRVVGVRRAPLILPVLLLAGLVAAVFSGGLGPVVLLRGLDGALRNSFHRPSSELLQVALPDRLRRRAKPLIDVLGLRVGQAAAAVILLLMIGAAAGPATRVAVVAGLLAAWALLARGLGRRYVDLLRSTLIRSGPAVTAPTEGLALDGEALAAVLAALDRGQDTEVLAGLELLAAHGWTALVPWRLLGHSSSAVVYRTLELLPSGAATAAAPGLVVALDRLLAHPDGAVRSAALRRRVALGADRAWLMRLASDNACPAVRGAAQVALVARGWLDPPSSIAALTALVTGGGIQVRLAVAQAIADHPAPAFEPVLRALMAAREPQVLELVAAALATIGGADALDALIDLLPRREGRAPAHAALARTAGAFEAVQAALADPARALGVRANAPRALVEIDAPRSVGPLLDGLLVETDGFVRYRILRALDRVRRARPGTPLDEDILGRAALAAVRSAYRYLAWRVFLEEGVGRLPQRRTPTSDLLRDLLAEKEENAVERLFRVLALRYPREDFRRLLRGVRFGEVRARAASRELIENLLAGPARALTLALVDDADDRQRLLAMAAGRPPRAPTYHRLLATIRDEEEGGMLGALAARHARELQEVTPLVHAPAFPAVARA